jgi:hypothetical protein
VCERAAANTRPSTSSTRIDSHVRATRPSLPSAPRSHGTDSLADSRDASGAGGPQARRRGSRPRLVVDLDDTREGPARPRGRVPTIPGLVTGSGAPFASLLSPGRGSSSCV